MSEPSSSGGSSSSGGGATGSVRTSPGAGSSPSPSRDREARAHRAETSRPGSGRVIAAVLLGLVVGVLGTLALVTMTDEDEAEVDPFAGLIQRDGYQAVILANDRVYFGKIEAAGADFYRLDDAFFLRETAAGEGDEAQATRALLPINRELHGPENSMLIRRSEVVLVEDLADDSPILREIERQVDAR